MYEGVKFVPLPMLEVGSQRFGVVPGKGLLLHSEVVDRLTWQQCMRR